MRPGGNYYVCTYDATVGATVSVIGASGSDGVALSALPASGAFTSAT